MLTPAQRSYLEMARRDGLPPDAIRPGSSFHCVLGLVYRGLLEKRYVPREMDHKFFPTEAGLKELDSQEV
jgi:hypothetical protein